jgi:hypothetical protein
MDNHETEQERKDRERKAILDELNNNSNINADIDSNIQSFGPTKKKSVVSFNRDDEGKVDNGPSLIVKPEQGNNKILTILLVGLVLVCIAPLAFPFVRGKFDDFRLSRKKVKVDVKEEVKEKEYEEITLESEAVQKLKYPIMHNDKNTKITYYSKDKLKITDFSNNDILYNALVDVYTGNMAKYTGKYTGKFCGGNNKLSLDARYLKLRIENLFNKNTKYTLTDFTVPANSTKTKYVGTWKYDRTSNKYIYYGNCNAVTNAAVQYYDIRVPYNASSNDKNVEIYVNNYVGFAAVNPTTKAYILYKDSAYTEEVTRGTLTTANIESELSSLVNKNKDSFNTYKFTYSIVDCAYQDYCFVSGAWEK